MTLAEVRWEYADLKHPPSDYYDVRNRKGTSPFPPGLPPEDYQPFIDHFEERAQTAGAQARLDRRKGHHDRAGWYETLAREWASAAQTCKNRQERSFLDAKVRAGSNL